MRYSATLLAIIASLLTACHKSIEPQCIAGFITSAVEGEQITLDVEDSIPSRRTYTITANTTIDGGALIEGNIAEVIYMPTEQATLKPEAISINTDENYARFLGRWRTAKQDKLQLDIALLARGRIEQIQPDTVLRFERWQLSGEENKIKIFGTLSLPPQKPSKQEYEKAKAEDKPLPAPSRRTMHFSATAHLADDDQGKSEHHKVLIITTDKGKESRLYPAW